MGQHGADGNFSFVTTFSAKSIGFGICGYLFKSAKAKPGLSQRARSPVFTSYCKYSISPVQAFVTYRASFPVIAALPNVTSEAYLAGDGLR